MNSLQSISCCKPSCIRQLPASSSPLSISCRTSASHQPHYRHSHSLQQWQHPRPHLPIPHAASPQSAGDGWTSGPPGADSSKDFSFDEDDRNDSGYPTDSTAPTPRGFSNMQPSSNSQTSSDMQSSSSMPSNSSSGGDRKPVDEPPSPWDEDMGGYMDDADTASYNDDDFADFGEQGFAASVGSPTSSMPRPPTDMNAMKRMMMEAGMGSMVNDPRFEKMFSEGFDPSASDFDPFDNLPMDDWDPYGEDSMPGMNDSGPGENDFGGSSRRMPQPFPGGFGGGGGGPPPASKPVPPPPRSEPWGSSFMKPKKKVAAKPAVSEAVAAAAPSPSSSSSFSSEAPKPQLRSTVKAVTSRPASAPRTPAPPQVQEPVVARTEETQRNAKPKSTSPAEPPAAPRRLTLSGPGRTSPSSAPRERPPMSAADFDFSSPTAAAAAAARLKTQGSSQRPTGSATATAPDSSSSSRSASAPKKQQPSPRVAAPERALGDSSVSPPRARYDFRSTSLDSSEGPQQSSDARPGPASTPAAQGENVPSTSPSLKPQYLKAPVVVRRAKPTSSSNSSSSSSSERAAPAGAVLSPAPRSSPEQLPAGSGQRVPFPRKRGEGAVGKPSQGSVQSGEGVQQQHEQGPGQQQQESVVEANLPTIQSSKKPASRSGARKPVGTNTASPFPSLTAGGGSEPAADSSAGFMPGAQDAQRQGSPRRDTSQAGGGASGGGEERERSAEEDERAFTMRFAADTPERDAAGAVVAQLGKGRRVLIEVTGTRSTYHAAKILATAQRYAHERHNLHIALQPTTLMQHNLTKTSTYPNPLSTPKPASTNYPRSSSGGASSPQEFESFFSDPDNALSGADGNLKRDAGPLRLSRFRKMDTNGCGPGEGERLDRGPARHLPMRVYATALPMSAQASGGRAREDEGWDRMWVNASTHPSKLAYALQRRVEVGGGVVLMAGGPDASERALQSVAHARHHFWARGHDLSTTPSWHNLPPRENGQDNRVLRFNVRLCRQWQPTALLQGSDELVVPQ